MKWLLRTAEERELQVKSVDTSALMGEEDYTLGNAAWVEGDEIVGYHITDKPEDVMQLLQSVPLSHQYL